MELVHLDAIRDAVIAGKQDTVKEAVLRALEEGVRPERLLNEGLIPAMSRVGALFEEKEFFVPEMMVAAIAMQAGLALLKPLLSATDAEYVGKVVIGTVKGDLHDIGKNLVGMMLEGTGFKVVDLGVDVSAERFVVAVREERPDILGMSALLTTTMGGMDSTMEALEKAGVRGAVKVIVGGAPLTEEYATRIGADGYAPDAGKATSLARRVIGIAPG